MKDISVLFVLVITQVTKVCPQPYQAEGNCRNQKTEYLLDEVNRCCSKCQPGQRLLQECSEYSDSVCKRCEPDQYMQDWNYTPNCFSCVKCKSSKGLEYAQNCSATTGSRCRCKPGWYCTLEFDDPYCSGCDKYKMCKVGYGVFVNGTKNSNVKCKICSSGTFSDTESYTAPCLPHTDCGSRAVVRKGNTTSDTVCEPEAFTSSTHTSKNELPVNPVMTSLITTLYSPSAWELTGSTQSVSEPVFNYSTNVPTQSTGAVSQTKFAVICGVAAVVLFFTIILLFFFKSIRKKDAERLHPKLDANGNCESGDKINRGYMEETLLTSFAVTSPEQQCLLETGEVSSDCSQCNNNTETLTRTEGSGSHESISPSQSTVLLNNPSSALSEPLPLISNTDPVTSQPSVLTQSSSQPTSPHIISPVTTSPHVNVNITFHIGNGSCGTPPVNPMDLIQAGCKLPLGQEEESFSIPQQEDGKQSLISVQESSCYSV